MPVSLCLLGDSVFRALSLTASNKYTYLKDSFVNAFAAATASRWTTLQVRLHHSKRAGNRLKARPYVPGI